MTTLAERLAKARKTLRMTQSDAAEHLGVSFQAVSLWERGETSPDIQKLPEIAALYQISLDWLLTSAEEDITQITPIDFDTPLSDRLFDENRMYTYVKTTATMKGLHQTLKVLPYMREKHAGQYRKGADSVPYMYHPLLMVCHALALELYDDDLLAAALLHDVCEDCDTAAEDLPVNDVVKEAVVLLTKNDDSYTDEGKKLYYAGIAGNPTALMVKLLDRCNNISGMAVAFSHEKLVRYINETETYFYPMMQQAKTDYPQYNNAVFLLRYHMASVISSLKHVL